MEMQLSSAVYSELVDEIRAINTEHVFQSRWILVEGYWKIGKLIVDSPLGSLEALQGLANDTQMSERTLYYARKMYLTYPDIQSLPEGKNITWNKIITKYITEKKVQEEHEHTPITICSMCKQKL
jgi:hypothetical protein